MNTLTTFVSDRKNVKYESARFTHGIYQTSDPVKIAKLKNSFWFNKTFRCVNDMIDEPEEPEKKNKREEALALVSNMKWPKLKAFAASKGVTVNKRKKDEIITDLLNVLVEE